MKTIIAATDYSALAKNAVEYAANVALINHAKLILFNDFTLSIHTLNGRIPGAEIDGLINANATRLRQNAEKLRARYAIDVLPIATFSFVEDEIKNLSNQHQVDLVVMGMHSQTLEQELGSSKTSSIIKNLRVPVLAVPVTAAFAGTKKILFACDLLNGVSKLLLTRIKNTATRLGAVVEVLLINQTVDDLRAVGSQQLALNGLNQDLSGIEYYYKNVQSDSVIQAIKNEIERYQADLLIMVPQKHGFWDSLIHRSKTRIMAAGLSIPLLSIPA